MSDFRLETGRLLLREMTQEDYPALAAILRDPQVMYAYEHAFSPGETQAWLDRQRDRYALYGHGLWAVVLKETGRMIGQCGLTWQVWRDSTVLEVGYHLRRDCWGRGYATEAARAAVDFVKLCAERTAAEGLPMREGVDFEPLLGALTAWGART